MPKAFLKHIFGDDAFGGPFAPATILRKTYALVAFTLVGFVVDRALPRSRRPVLRGALIVAAFSSVIEIMQIRHHATEGPLVHAFDILSGAAGGAAGGLLANLRRVTR